MASCNHLNFSYLQTVRVHFAQLQLKTAVDQLRSLTTSPLRSKPLSQSDKSVQTDFPASMLEEYVIKNRKRILALLGVQRVVSTSASSGANVGQGPIL